MYLRVLKRKEKEALLELAQLVSSADNDFSVSEQTVIRDFRKEIYLSENDYPIHNYSFSEILTILEESSPIAKLSIFLEIVSLVMIDHKCHPQELSIIESLRIKWNISDEIYHQVEDWIKDLSYQEKEIAKIELIKQGDQFINEEQE